VIDGRVTFGVVICSFIAILYGQYAPNISICTVSVEQSGVLHVDVSLRWSASVFNVFTSFVHLFSKLFCFVSDGCTVPRQSLMWHCRRRCKQLLSFLENGYSQ